MVQVINTSSTKAKERSDGSDPRSRTSARANDLCEIQMVVKSVVCVVPDGIGDGLRSSTLCNKTTPACSARTAASCQSVAARPSDHKAPVSGTPT